MADEELEHPALKNFNEGIYTAKHVAGKTLKSTLMGAVIGGGAITALAAGAAMFSPLGLAAAAGTAIAEWIGFGPGLLGATGMIAGGGAVVGGVAGAAVGAATSIANADEAVAARKEEIVAQAEKNEMRVQHREAMEAQRANMHAAAEAQAASLHVAPPQALPVKGMDGAFLG